MLGPGIPRSTVRAFQELWPAANQRWEGAGLERTGACQHWFTCLMLFLFSCLCTPEGGTPGTPEVERRKPMGTRGEGRAGPARGMLVRFQTLVLRFPTNLEPAPNPVWKKQASARQVSQV